jgi:hypothetical protein
MEGNQFGHSADEEMKYITDCKELSGCSQKPWTRNSTAGMAFNDSGDSSTCTSSVIDDSSSLATLTTIVYEAVMSNASNAKTVINESVVQATFAEQTALEMEEIVRWYNRCDNRDTEEDSQSLCLVRNSLAASPKSHHDKSGHPNDLPPPLHDPLSENSTSESTSSPISTIVVVVDSNHRIDVTTPPLGLIEVKECFEAAATQKKAVDDICQRTKDMEEIARSLFSVHISPPNAVCTAGTTPQPSVVPTLTNRNSSMDTVSEARKSVRNQDSTVKRGGFAGPPKSQFGSSKKGSSRIEIFQALLSWSAPLVLFASDPLQLQGALLVFLVGWVLYSATFHKLVLQQPAIIYLGLPQKSMTKNIPAVTSRSITHSYFACG